MASERQTWVDQARVFSILMVVLYHVTVPSLKQAADFGGFSWWVCDVYASFSRWGIPVFVMISGALHLELQKKETAAEFYNKRAKRLLLPLAFWAWCMFMVNVLSGHFHPVGGFPYLQTIADIAFGKPLKHLWFIYMILVLYLYTPFIRVLLRRISSRVLGFIILGLFGMTAANSAFAVLVRNGDPGILFTYFLNYLPYFLCGHYLRQKGVTDRPGRWLALFLASFAVTAYGSYLLREFYGKGEQWLYFYNRLSVAVIPMAISVFILLRNVKKPFLERGLARTLAGLVFGVYLIHSFFILALRQTRLDILGLYPLLLVPVLTLGVFLLSITTAYLFSQNKYLKRVV